MHKNFPSELPELLARHQRCVWPGVVLMEHDSSPIHQCWPLLFDRQLQTVELFTVEDRIERLAIREQLIVEYSLPIPPNTQQHLPGRQSWLGRFVGFRPRSLSLDVLVSDPLFITSHHPLQKWVDFVAIQQQFADENSVHGVFLRQLVWDPNIELFFESSFLQTV